MKLRAKKWSYALNPKNSQNADNRLGEKIHDRKISCVSRFLPSESGDEDLASRSADDQAESSTNLSRAFAKFNSF